MKLTVKQYAAHAGIAERTVRDKLARGVLAGGKEPDPVTGIDVWWIELPDAADPPRPAATPSADAADPPEGVGNVAFIEVLNRHQEIIEKLHRENVELAGRLGFYQARNQELERRVLELEAPKNGAAPRGAEGNLVHTREGLMVEYQDRDLTCVACGQVFLLTAGERGFYSKRGLVEPKRCSTCRAARRQQKKQARAEHIQTSILTDHAPAEMSNYTAPEQNGQDVGARTVLEILGEQSEAGRKSEVSVPPATNGQEGSSGGAFKRFWRWLTQPV